MKKKTRKLHFVSITFVIPKGKSDNDIYHFAGLVSGQLTNSGRLRVSPDKIFKQAFGKKLPENITLIY